MPSTMKLIVWNQKVLEHLIVQHEITAADIIIDNSTTSIIIDSERDLLLRSILSHMQQGCGGECFVQEDSNNTILHKFCTRFDSKTTLGGAPVRAAAAIRNV